MDTESPLKAQKYCSKCKKEKDISFFSNLGGTNYSRPECKECMSAYIKHTSILKKTWMSERPSSSSSYCCPICTRTWDKIPIGEHGPAGKNKWCLDHNHISGEVRGWLCHSCNLLIGKLEKSGGIQAAERAIRYLRGEFPPPSSPSKLPL
jgi:hypothetical protein